MTVTPGPLGPGTKLFWILLMRQVEPVSLMHGFHSVLEGPAPGTLQPRVAEALSEETLECCISSQRETG